MRGRRVLVLGDVMLDEFVWGRGAASPRGARPGRRGRPGRATRRRRGQRRGNVRSLGGDAVLAAVVGRDAAGARVREALARPASWPGWSTRAGRRTTLKDADRRARTAGGARRPRRHGRSAPRARDALVGSCAASCRRCDALVVSDYQKGVVTAALLRRVLPLARRRQRSGAGRPEAPPLPALPRGGAGDPEPARGGAGAGLRLDGTGARRAPGARILSLAAAVAPCSSPAASTA